MKFLPLAAAAIFLWCAMPVTPAAAQKPKPGAGKAQPKGSPKWVKTKSGLQYMELAVGKGKSPKLGDSVKVHYTGWFTNGREFDSSIGGAPAEFKLGQGLIQGWNECLQTMKPGGKRKLVVPSDLGYGPQGYRDIPPNATLVFEIELLSVKAAKK